MTNVNIKDYKGPDGRSFEDMTDEERSSYEDIRQIYEGKPLSDDALESVSGGLTFRETKWDRFRLHTYAFFNGEMDVMMQIQTGVPLSQISWRP